MKAKELAKLIMLFPDAEIILSSDSEGNSYGTVEHKKDKSSMSSICPVITKKDIEEFGIKKPIIILYPWRECLTLDEI